MKIRVFTLCCIAGLVALNAGAGEIISLDEQGWPQFRGTRRDGVSHETGLLQEWPQAGPKLLWQVSDLGEGYSSPIVTNDGIFVTGDANGELVIYCFSADGRLLWKTSNGKAWNGPWPGARSTCTYANDRVFHMNAHGRAVCLDPESGRTIWSVDVLDRFDGPNIKWGLSECLLVDGDHVIVTPGGKKAFMAALDTETGATVWKTPPLEFQRTYLLGGKQLEQPITDYDKAGYASPILFEVGGRRLIARTSGQHLVCVDAETGSYVWTHKTYAQFEVIGSIPVFWNDHVYFSAPDAFGGRMFSVRSIKGNMVFEEVWNTPVDNCHASSVIVGNLLFGSGYRRVRDWTCIDAATGRTIFSKHDMAIGASVFADGCLYALGEDGVMELLKPDDDGFKTMGRLRLTEGKRRDVWAHPVICNRKLYLRDHDTMWCYDLGAR